MIIAVTYARMNPPTTGHALLVRALKEVHAHERRIYLSPSQDSTSNPLDSQTKLSLVRAAFQDIDIIVSSIMPKDMFEMLTHVGKLGYKELVLVVGGDRYEEMRHRVHTYNGALYDFNDIRIVNAGARDDSGDSVTGMSASKLREAAKLNDHANFELGLPLKLRPLSRDIMLRVQEACKQNHLQTS